MSRARKTRRLLAISALLVAGQAGAQEFNLAPVVLNGSGVTGATFGFQWELKDNLYSKPVDSASVAQKELTVDYKLNGVITGDKERNPKNFNDGLVDAKFLYSDVGLPAIAAGAFVKYEADQSFDNRQSVYGLRATLLKLGLLANTKTDIYALDANLGRVDPSKDTERQAVLGSENLDRYSRWDVEVWVNYPLTAPLHNIQLSYRYFRELDPPDAIVAAGLHRHRLGTVRLGLTSELFVAYSKGKLPFDRTDEKIFEIGWTYKLK